MYRILWFAVYCIGNNSWSVQLNLWWHCTSDRVSCFGDICVLVSLFDEHWAADTKFRYWIVDVGWITLWGWLSYKLYFGLLFGLNLDSGFEMTVQTRLLVDCDSGFCCLDCWIDFLTFFPIDIHMGTQYLMVPRDPISAVTINMTHSFLVFIYIAHHPGSDYKSSVWNWKRGPRLNWNWYAIGMWRDWWR